MKPIDIENHILVTLMRLAPATIPMIKRRLTTPGAHQVTFRCVASATLRLERQGLIYQSGDVTVGIDTQPQYTLTQAGMASARTIQRQQATQQGMCQVGVA